MSRWLRRPIIVSLAALVAVGLLAACSGDDASPRATATGDVPAGATAPAEYMEGLCAAIASFRSDLNMENAALQDSISADEPTPEGMKEDLKTFLGALSDRSQRLVDDVNALGTPAVDNGDEVRSALTAGVEQVVQLFEEARADIAALPTDDPDALLKGFVSAGARLQEAATEISGSLEDLSSPDLEEAAADAPSCQGVL